MSATSTTVDPAVRATQELNQFFSQMEVPCQVVHTDTRGKYVVASADIPAGTELVEEVPMIAWPSADLLSSTLPFCFHCLRLRSHHAGPHKANTEASDSAATPPTLSWNDCSKCGSWFCSTACCDLASRTHRLLCPSLGALRQTADTTTTATQQQTGHDGITCEGLARCVAWLFARMARAIETQSLSYNTLHVDFQAQKAIEGAAENVRISYALVSQLFTQTAAPFNRLIAPPDGTVLAGVNKAAWFAQVRDAVSARGAALLRLAAGGETETDAGSDDDWASAIVEAAVSDDTLTTMLGQLTLNAHAVNDYVFLNSSNHVGDGDDTAGTSEAASPVPFTWMLKGAAVYTLLSAFNHSCCPNMAVSFVDGTSEICLKTTEEVKKGEELCITYIPVPPNSTRAERHAQLKNYLFECRCPLCKNGP